MTIMCTHAFGYPELESDVLKFASGSLEPDDLTESLLSAESHNEVCDNIIQAAKTLSEYRFNSKMKEAESLISLRDALLHKSDVLTDTTSNTATGSLVGGGVGVLAAIIMANYNQLDLPYDQISGMFYAVGGFLKTILFAVLGGGAGTLAGDYADSLVSFNVNDKAVVIDRAFYLNSCARILAVPSID